MTKQKVQELLDFIDASPSPWHAVASIEKRIQAHHFTKLEETDKWQLQANGRYYVIRDDSSIIAFIVGSKALAETGFKIVGAHTDSPGLRLKPNAPHAKDGVLRLGVEVYGGPILATFTDRDLSLAGRVSYQSEQGEIFTRLVNFEEPLLRLPNLAIHMNRNVNQDGLKLNKQSELPLILSILSNEQVPRDYFLSLIQQQTGINPDQLMSWEFNIYDTQKGAFWGAEQEFYSNSQLDNLASCHAALEALLNQSEAADGTLVCAFFDHEEIGSESSKGADGSFLPDILQRLTLVTGNDHENYQRALALSFMISADMAHAYQPNFSSAYESEHKVMVNQGPVIKVNANHRYTSESTSQAMFINWCNQAEIPYQKYSHHSDIPCGSTIGPMISAKLGILTVDVGNPMWAMHSIRESAGTLDHEYMIKVLEKFFWA